MYRMHGPPPQDPVALEGCQDGSWLQRMTDHYGPDVLKWPQPGCGARFAPWARGPSMVVEMKTEADERVAFLAERPYSLRMVSAIPVFPTHGADVCSRFSK